MITGFDERMVTNGDGSVTFYGPGGLSGVFAKDGSGFDAPKQFQATLTGTSSAYVLTDHASREKLTFDSSGRLSTDADRDGNTTTYTWDSYGHPYQIVSSRGPANGRKVTLTTSSGRITKLSQTSGTLTRSVSLGYSPNGHLASVTDATSGVTSFSSGAGTDTGQVVSITNPMSEVTTLGFVSGQVSSVSQTNPPTDGGAGTSTTRLTYPSSTQTLVADPTTDQGTAVASVAHTTYTLDSASSQLVSSAEDPDNNTRSKTYTTLGDTASTTNAAGGATSYTYGSNGGESLTSVGNAGGATESASYGSGANAYMPSSTTDDAGNSLTNTYDTNGNQTDSAQGSGASPPTAHVDYNSNGTASASRAPGAGSTVKTTYTYGNGDADLTKITPPSGSSLVHRDYTWDSFGRLSTATDGAGDTITYTYDYGDRITKVQYSDGTHEVDYTYDADGHVKTRVDGNGTTSYSYDDLGHLLSTANTANSHSVSYSYDLAGGLATETDALGTTTYGYDAAHELTSMTYPEGGTTHMTLFANDSDARRTDAWLQSNSNHTSWAAHEHYTYDSSGRMTHALGQIGPASGPSNAVDETMCFTSGSTGGSSSCPAATGTGTSSTDRSNIQWTYDSVSGETNTYTYDTSDRLTKDVVSGGSNPRTYTYTYDDAGNRKTATVTGSSPSSQSLTFNSGNQISSTGYTYDAAGNLTTSPTRSATFNAAGQQTSTTVGSTTSAYTYAGTNMNEVLSATNQGGRSYTLSYGMPDKNGIPEIDSVQAGTSGTGYVLHDPSGQPVMLQTSSAISCLYLYDGTGNPVAMSTDFNTTAIALRYDPYGAATRTDSGGANGAWTQNPYAFGEGIQDRNTGELKFGQRIYSPTTGSWTQQDTLNAPLDPSNGNRYEYAGDNPVNNHDAIGRDFLSLGINFNLGPIHVGVGVDIGDGGVHPYAQAGVGASAGSSDSPISPTASLNSGSAQSGGSVGVSGCVSGACVGAGGPSVDLTGSTGVSADATYTF